MEAVKDLPALWIEWTDESSEDGAARWGWDNGNITDAQIDAIVAFAVGVLGEPDTIR